jgi:hypothetical protein
MGYAMIDKFLRAIQFGAPINAWYRVPTTWDDNDWHIIVRPPLGYSVVLQDVDFHGNETAALHLILAYQLRGNFYEFDEVQSFYEHGKRTYVQTMVLPKNAEFVIRRQAQGPAVHLTCRGYFIRPTKDGARRIATNYGTYTAPGGL